MGPQRGTLRASSGEGQMHRERQVETDHTEGGAFKCAGWRGAVGEGAEGDRPEDSLLCPDPLLGTLESAPHQVSGVPQTLECGGPEKEGSQGSFQKERVGRCTLLQQLVPNVSTSRLRLPAAP